MRILFLSLLLTGACATAPADSPPESIPSVPEARAADGLPKGAKREASGFVTIGLVPPSALPHTPPPMPRQLDTFARQTSMGTPEQQAAAWERANGSAEFQREFQRLRELIERREKGNLSAVRLVRDPGVMGEFAFYRDGPETLAQYTRDPRFRGVTTGVDPVSLADLESLWLQRIREEKAPIPVMGSNTSDGVLELTVGIAEAEFRRLARDKGWDIADSRLEFKFPEPRPEPFADPALAPLVRAFPRENQAAGIRLTALGSGRVVLKDGCFRLGDDGGRAGDTLVMFARGSQLALDEEGYLIVRTDDEDRQYRIGEPGNWGGPNAVDKNSEDVRALRAACGTHPIVNIAAPSSATLFATPAPLWVLDYAHTKGITYERAWQQVIGCMERHLDKGRRPLEARDRCVRQYNGWDFRGEEMPPPPGQ